MMIVMEKLVTVADGSVRVFRKEISYTTAQKLCGNRSGWNGSTLAIFANVFAGCDHTEQLDDGRIVWKSSIDSTNVYLEAGGQ